MAALSASYQFMRGAANGRFSALRPLVSCAANDGSWKLCTNMRAEDVTDTLDLALEASGCDQVQVVHKPRLLSDNG